MQCKFDRRFRCSWLQPKGGQRCTWPPPLFFDVLDWCDDWLRAEGETGEGRRYGASVMAPSGVQDVPQPVGWGTTWSSLLTSIGYCIGAWLTLVFVCALVDAARVLARRRKRGSVARDVRAWFAPLPLQSSSALLQNRYVPCSTARSELLPQVRLDAATVTLGLIQFFLFLVSTYLTAPVKAGPGVIVVTVLLAAFFAARQVFLLSRAAPGTRARTAASFQHVCEALATAALVTPYISGTWFGLSALRLVGSTAPAFERLWCAWSGSGSRGGGGGTRLEGVLMRAGTRLFVFLALTATLVATLERAGDPPGWDVVSQGQFAMVAALYWSVVTVSTAGYGDITPITVLGRAATSLAILAALALIAAGTRSLLDAINEDRRGDGSIARSVGASRALVLLVGDVGRDKVIAAARELLLAHGGLGARYLHCVCLVESHTFDPELHELLGRDAPGLVTYLRGSVTSVDDLSRAGALSGDLQAVLVLQRFNARDERNLLRVLALRAALPLTPLLVALARHDARHHAECAGLAEDSLLCLDMLRMGLLAQATLTPGSSTLILNLLTSAHSLAAESSPAAVASLPQHLQLLPPALQQTRPLPLHSVHAFAAALLAGRLPAAASTLAPPRPWLEEYTRGSDQLVWEIRVPSWIVGRSQCEAAILLFLANALAQAHISNSSFAQLLRAPQSSQQPPQQQHLLDAISAQLEAGAVEGLVLLGVRTLDASSARSHISSNLLAPTLLKRGDTLFVIASSLSSLVHESLVSFRHLRSVTLASPSVATPVLASPPPAGEAEGEGHALPPPPAASMLALHVLRGHIALFWPAASLDALHLFLVPFVLGSRRPVVLLCSAPDVAAVLADCDARVARLLLLRSGAAAGARYGASPVLPPPPTGDARASARVWHVRTGAALATLAEMGAARLRHAHRAVVVSALAEEDSDARPPGCGSPLDDAPAVLLTRTLERRFPRLAGCVTELLLDASAELLGPLAAHQLQPPVPPLPRSPRGGGAAGRAGGAVARAAAVTPRAGAAPLPHQLPRSLQPIAIPHHHLRRLRAPSSAANVLLQRSASRRLHGDAPVLDAFSLTSPLGSIEDNEGGAGDEGSVGSHSQPWRAQPVASLGTLVGTERGIAGSSGGGGGGETASSRGSDASREGLGSGRQPFDAHAQHGLPLQQHAHQQLPPPQASSVRVDARYAAGRLLPLCLFSQLLAQGYFNPSALRLVSLLAHGGEEMQIFSTPCPAALVGASWARLWLTWLVQRRDGVPIGLYRHGAQKRLGASPYVFTNPLCGDVVRASDSVFVVGTAAAAAAAASMVGATITGVPFPRASVAASGSAAASSPATPTALAAAATDAASGAASAKRRVSDPRTTNLGA